MQKIPLVGDRKLYFPFIIVTFLFLLWGTAHGMLDILNKHFQDAIHLTKFQSAFIQTSLYGGYLFMSIPAGIFMKKFGYRKGIIFGLCLFALGSFAFIPVSHIQEFWAVLAALFIIACGLTCLENAANPYSTILGPKETAARRINFSQAFNGIGWILGPLLGTILIYGADKHADNFQVVTAPYVIIGSFVLATAIVFCFIKLPDIHAAHTDSTETLSPDTVSVKEQQSIWHYPHFWLGAIAQFLYVAAQTGLNSFFINFTIDANLGISKEAAGYILSFGGMGSFFIGRILGSYVMSKVQPERLLAVYAGINTVLMLLTIMNVGFASVVGLFLSYFFMSIMFPTIFAMGIRDMGPHTQKASSWLVMGVAGGAVCPLLMGKIADLSAMNVAFIIPCLCFAFITYYGIVYKKMLTKVNNNNVSLSPEIRS